MSLRTGLKIYHRLVSVIVITGGLVGAALLFTVTLTTFYEVIARYLLGRPTSWSLDYGIYLVMWGTFLGAGYTLKWRGHICVEVLVEKLSKEWRRNLKIMVYALSLVFCIILAWRGLVSCLDAYEYSEVTLSYSRTPLYVPMLSIPVGSALMVLEIISQIIGMFQEAGEEK